MTTPVSDIIEAIEEERRKKSYEVMESIQKFRDLVAAEIKVSE